MATWIIGDVHGHARALERLLTKIAFDPCADRLVFVGDLVNGGGENVAVLRRARELGATVCLGNHDLHMLAVSAGQRELRGKDDFDDVLAAPDRDELLGWLHTRDIAWRDDELDILVVHAGVLPSWSANEVMQLAAEVEAVLRSEDYAPFFAAMYGDEPSAWDPNLRGGERLRVLVNAFTRMRILDAAGHMEFRYNGSYDSIPDGWAAWFDRDVRATEETCVVFGHWSALGLRRTSNAICIDSGVRWGRALTAYRADDGHVVQETC